MKDVRTGLENDTDGYARDMGTLVKAEWFEKMIDCKCNKFRMTVMVAYIPCHDSEERFKDNFWRKIERTVKAADSGVKPV